MKQSLLNRESEFNGKWSDARRAMKLREASNNFAIESRNVRMQAIKALGMKVSSVHDGYVVFKIPYGGNVNKHSLFTLNKSEIRSFMDQIANVINNRTLNSRVAVITNDTSDESTERILKSLVDKGYDKYNAYFYNWEWFSSEGLNIQELVSPRITHICLVGNVPETSAAGKVLSWIAKRHIQVVYL